MARTSRCKTLLLACGLAGACGMAQADEGGVSFWLPGQFGSLAAVPTPPGWSLGTVYYHTSGDLGSDVLTQRGNRVTAGVDARGDLLFLGPNYAFEQPLWGAQPSVAVLGAYGRLRADVSATFTGPRGNALSGAISDSTTGFADLYALGTLKWHKGVHNYMGYVMTNIPVGSYDPARLVNTGLGHWALDAGGGYTYFDKRDEFSAVLGFTFNGKNSDTDYKNGVSSHLDWAASHFFDQANHAGVVGYVYHQLTGDSGSGALLGDFKSRVAAIGPQYGHFFKVGSEMWYLNLKGYYEFGAKNRPEGWNAWITLSIPLGGGKK